MRRFLLLLLLPLVCLGCAAAPGELMECYMAAPIAVAFYDAQGECVGLQETRDGLPCQYGVCEGQSIACAPLDFNDPSTVKHWRLANGVPTTWCVTCPGATEPTCYWDVPPMDFYYIPVPDSTWRRTEWGTVRDAQGGD